MEVERGAAIGHSRTPHRLIRNTGSQSPSLRQMVKESDGLFVHCHERWLERRVEQFREQFSWSSSTMEILQVNGWE